MTILRQHFLIFFFLFLSAPEVFAAKLEIIGHDPANGHVGFARAHWASSINKMLVFLVPGKDNSVRAFDPVQRSWEYLWPNSNSTNGPQARDNYGSFYVARLDELWVWGGSYLTESYGKNAIFSGRFSISKKRWIATGADDNGAFKDVVSGPVVRTGTDPAAAWSAESDTGIIFGGGAGGSPSDEMWIISPNPEGPQPYKSVRFTGPRPPPRAQCMNCMVAAGKDFYLFGGFYQEPNNPAYLNRKDLWKFDTAKRVWIQLPPPPDVAYAPVLTYDSDRNALVAWVRNKVLLFDLGSQKWSEQTPAGGIPSISNQVGVYSPTAKRHLFLGGNLNDSNAASPGTQVYALALEGPVPASLTAERREQPRAPENSGGFDIPLRTWVARPYNTPNAPAAGLNGRGGVGSKHLRFAQSSLNGKIYVLGGDYQSDVYSDIQLWTYDVPTNRWARDKEPPCGVEGEILPGGPDEVGWVWDTKRKQFWVLPGFYFFSEGVFGACGGGGSTGQSWDVSKPLTLDGYAVYLVVDHKTGKRYEQGKDYSVTPNGPKQIVLKNISIPPGDLRVFWQTPGKALQLWKILTYDPVTKKWSDPKAAPDPSFGTRNGVYDPVTDSIYRSALSPSGLFWSAYRIAENRWDVYSTPRATNGTPLNTNLDHEYIAIDVKGRKIYAIDPYDYRLLQFDIDRHTLAIKAPIPEPAPQRINAARARSWTLSDATMPVFDSVNNVLLYPFVTDLSSDYAAPAGEFTGSRPRLLIYHPDTDRWETDRMLQPEGMEVRANSFFFDPIHNALLAMGGLARGGDNDTSVTHYFLYRYGNGAGSAPAVAEPAPAPPVNPPSTLRASFFGVTGEDKVGENNQITPNGKPDFHISVSGLRGTPVKINITSDTGGIWETPYNGLHWIIATSYDGKEAGDFWFEQFASKKFHVKVWYGDGTSDEADAREERLPRRPNPASTLRAAFLGVTGEDKVGENNQVTPNGKPDFHISVSGLRGTPSRINITSDTGGIWETPFNGKNWILASSYDADGVGHFWFEPIASKRFRVRVWYPDGTTDEAATREDAAPAGLR